MRKNVVSNCFKTPVKTQGTAVLEADELATYERSRVREDERLKDTIVSS